LPRRCWHQQRRGKFTAPFRSPHRCVTRPCLHQRGQRAGPVQLRERTNGVDLRPFSIPNALEPARLHTRNNFMR
jgi:hypothetical protein